MLRTAFGRSKSQLPGPLPRLGPLVRIDRDSELGPVLKYTSALAGLALFKYRCREQNYAGFNHHLHRN
jgi:hypothetical protein